MMGGLWHKQEKVFSFFFLVLSSSSWSSSSSSSSSHSFPSLIAPPPSLLHTSRDSSRILWHVLSLFRSDCALLELETREKDRPIDRTREFNSISSGVIARLGWARGSVSLERITDDMIHQNKAISHNQPQTIQINPMNLRRLTSKSNLESERALPPTFASSSHHTF